MTAKINNKQHVYVGIDVAFAKKKRLPVCVCRSNGAVLEVLPLRDSFMKPPAGKGNRAALVEGNCRSFAAEVADWLKKLETQKGLVIERLPLMLQDTAPKANVAPPNVRWTSGVSVASQHQRKVSST